MSSLTTKIQKDSDIFGKLSQQAPKKQIEKIIDSELGSLIEKPDYSIHVDGTEADKKEYRSRIGLNSYIAYTSIKNLKKLNAYTKKCNAMFDYHGRFRYFYNIFMDLVILVSLIYSAFAIGFISKENISDVNLGIDITVLVLFSIEIIINFLTIYYDDQGSQVQNPSAVAFLYLKFWFWLDIIPIIPLSFFGQFYLDHFFNMIRLLKLGNIFTLIEFDIISPIKTLLVVKYARYKESMIVGLCWDLFQLILRLCFTAYFVGSFFSYFVYVTRNQDSNSQNDFFDKNDLIEMEDKDLFLYVLYFTLTTLTTVGYGDYSATNAYEAIFICFILVAGVAFFSVLIGSASDAINQLSQLDFKSDWATESSIWLEQLESIKGKMPKRLKKVVIRNFINYDQKDRLLSLRKNYWEARSLKDLISQDIEYLSVLSQRNRHQVFQYLLDDIFSHFSKFFDLRDKLKSQTFQYQIAPHFQPRSYKQGEKILSIGEFAQEIVLIQSGNVAVLSADMQNLKQLGYRSVIGLQQTLSEEPSYFNYQVVGKQQVDGIAIPIIPYLKIIRGLYPGLLQQHYSLAQQQHESIVQGLSEQEQKKIQQIALEKIRSQGTKLVIDSLGSIIEEPINLMGNTIKSLLMKQITKKPKQSIEDQLFYTLETTERRRRRKLRQLRKQLQVFFEKVGVTE